MEHCLELISAKHFWKSSEESAGLALPEQTFDTKTCLQVGAMRVSHSHIHMTVLSSHSLKPVWLHPGFLSGMVLGLCYLLVMLGSCCWPAVLIVKYYVVLCKGTCWFRNLSWKTEMCFLGLGLGPLQSWVSWTHNFDFPKEWANGRMPKATGYSPLLLHLGYCSERKDRTKKNIKPDPNSLYLVAEEMTSLKVLGFKLCFHLYVYSLPSFAVQTVNTMSISWVSYWELKGGRCEPHPKVFPTLLLRAVFWKSSLHMQDKSANVSWEY